MKVIGRWDVEGPYSLRMLTMKTSSCNRVVEAFVRPVRSEGDNAGQLECVASKTSKCNGLSFET